MCGIAGICSTQPFQQENLVDLLHIMQNCMVHRGPDDGGIWHASDNSVGLANRRLAIIDLSPSGHMPMQMDDGNLVITYNGEVYNFAEVRDELRGLGHQFCSETDTEVILMAYKQWGQACVQRLRGMFAFAIWDTLRQKLFAARDRLGIKPFYYTLIGNQLAFASELTMLRQAMPEICVLNPQAVSAFLQLGYIPAPLTIYQNVFALPAAHTLAWNADETKIERYWDIPNKRRVLSYEEAVEEVRSVLSEAVRLHMISDAPLGAFLSGGIDSSSLIALMRNWTTGTLRTCSITFDVETYSEASFAQEVAQEFGTEHFERRITAQEVRADFDMIMRHMDQPTIDGVNTYFVSKVAKEAGLTVALSGLGGDELFAGYPTTFESVPKVARSLQLAHSVPGAPFFLRQAFRILPNAYRWAKLSEAMRRPVGLSSAYIVRRGLFTQSEIKRLIHPDITSNRSNWFDPVTYIDDLMPASFDHTFFWISQVELTSYTQNQLLRDTDVMSMAHSLEVRVPFLDHVLVEKIHSLPPTLHNRRDGFTKPVLRSVLQDQLPDKVSKRSKKQGFEFPFAVWLRRDLWNEVEQMLATSEFERHGIISPTGVEELKIRFQNGELQWARLWAVVVLAQWIAQHP